MFCSWGNAHYFFLKTRMFVILYKKITIPKNPSLPRNAVRPQLGRSRFKKFLNNSLQYLWNQCSKLTALVFIPKCTNANI